VIVAIFSLFVQTAAADQIIHYRQVTLSLSPSISPVMVNVGRAQLEGSAEFRVGEHGTFAVRAGGWSDKDGRDARLSWTHGGFQGGYAFVGDFQTGIQLGAELALGLHQHSWREDISDIDIDIDIYASQSLFLFGVGPTLGAKWTAESGLTLAAQGSFLLGSGQQTDTVIVKGEDTEGAMGEQTEDWAFRKPALRLLVGWSF
jgi:hypothetical protein